MTVDPIRQLCAIPEPPRPASRSGKSTDIAAKSLRGSERLAFNWMERRNAALGIPPVVRSREQTSPMLA